MIKKEIKALLDTFDERLPKLSKSELPKVMRKFNIRPTTKLIRNLRIRELRRKSVPVIDILNYRPFGFEEGTSDTVVYDIAASPMYELFEEYYKLKD